ncbi:MAG: hypothetical protein HOY71_40990 [Nonomuraea sp.]|nr:hypothetical protein [Nonomuraea sp.]
MGMFRMVVAFGLAAVAVGAAVWCAVIASPVPRAAVPTADPGKALQLDEHAGREAATTITVVRATSADLAGAQQGRIDDRANQAKVMIAHRLTLPAEDPLALTLRQGLNRPGDLQAFTDGGFGALKVSGTALEPTIRLAPLVTTTGDRTVVEFAVTLLRQFPTDKQLTLTLEPPARNPLLVGQRTITLAHRGWTMMALQGVIPEVEQADTTGFTVARARVIAGLVPNGTGFPDAEVRDDFSWGTALGVLTSIVMIWQLLRSLGTAWWQRLPNRELAVGLVLAAPTLLIPLFDQRLVAISYVIMFLALPAFAIRHVARTVPTSPPWTTRDVIGVTVLGVAVALGMLAWSWLHEQLPGPFLAGAALVVALAAAGSGLAFSGDLGIRLVAMRAAVVSAGLGIGVLALGLWIKALLTQVYPPDSVRLVLGLAWATIPIAAVAVATRGWSRVTVLCTIVVSLLVQGWPTEWLDAGSWSLPVDAPLPKIGALELNPLMRGVLGLLLLGFVLLVLRLRRLGGSVDSLGRPAAVATMIIVLMVLYLQPRGIVRVADSPLPLAVLSITSIMAWLSVRWLLSGPRPPLVEPRTPEEHRRFVRRALHKRLLQISEQELFRLGRGKLGAGELTMAEFERRRHDLERALHKHDRHPETAFGTAAACSPWHNALHAFVVSLLLTLPFVLVYGWPSGVDVTSFAFDARYLLALPAFGFFYGYFYPLIRGTQPMTKALNLMAAALVTELSGYLPTLFQPDPSAADKLQVAAIVIGEVAMVFIGLGLYWEWRIMHLAGEPWGRVRNIRSIRSLGAPLLAILIAFGTAAATTAAGQTVSRILQGP